MFTAVRICSQLVMLITSMPHLNTCPAMIEMALEEEPNNTQINTIPHRIITFKAFTNNKTRRKFGGERRQL